MIDETIDYSSVSNRRGGAHISEFSIEGGCAHFLIFHRRGRGAYLYKIKKGCFSDG